jgi:hypothetical protein
MTAVAWLFLALAGVLGVELLRRLGVLGVRIVERRNELQARLLGLGLAEQIVGERPLLHAQTYRSEPGRA